MSLLQCEGGQGGQDSHEYGDAILRWMLSVPIAEQATILEGMDK